MELGAWSLEHGAWSLRVGLGEKNIFTPNRKKYLKSCAFFFFTELGAYTGRSSDVCIYAKNMIKKLLFTDV
jgi:hypothetical protein